MTSGRDRVLGAVRAALAGRGRSPRPEWSAGDVRVRPAAGDVEGALAVTGTRVVTDCAALVELLREAGARRGWCDPALAGVATALRAAFEIVEVVDRDSIDALDFGVSRAAAAVVETGSLVLTDGETPSRLGALAPWVHVAVLRRADAHRTLLDLLTSLPPDPNVVLVTGPSRTADVEGVLVEGVHGPGLQVCLLLP